MVRTLVVLVSLALAALAGASPTATELYARAAEQFRAADAVRADVILSDHEDLRTATRIARASIVVDLDADLGPVAYRVDARLSGDGVPRGARFLLTTDGTDAQLINYAAKTEHRTSFDAISETDAFAGQEVMADWISHVMLPGKDLNQAFDETGISVRTEREGRDECDVISYQIDGGIGVAIYLAKDSGLPVRFDFTNPGDFSPTIRINKLRLNTKAPPSTFTIRPAPRGFTSATADKEAPSDGAKNTSRRATESTKALSPGDTAPDWTLSDAKGKPHSLSDYRGEVVLMDFWATWCGPCRRAMPGLQRLHTTYKDKGLNVVGINTSEESPDMAVGHMRSQRYTYQLLLRGDDVAGRYNVKGLPTFYLIGKDGEILYTASGFAPQLEHKLEGLIRDALGLAPEPIDPDEDEEELDEFEDY